MVASPLVGAGEFRYSKNPNAPGGITADKRTADGWQPWVFSAPSTIPNAGMGLFAGQNFKANETIGHYCGETLNESERFEEQQNREKGLGSHLLVTGGAKLQGYEYSNGYTCTRAEYVLGENIDPVIGHPDALIPLVNSIKGMSVSQKKKQNVKFISRGGVWGRECRATKDIALGDELITDYGDTINFFKLQNEAYEFWDGIPLRQQPTVTWHTADNEAFRAELDEIKQSVLAGFDVMVNIKDTFFEDPSAILFGEGARHLTAILRPMVQRKRRKKGEPPMIDPDRFTFAVITTDEPRTKGNLIEEWESLTFENIKIAGLEPADEAGPEEYGDGEQ